MELPRLTGLIRQAVAHMAPFNLERATASREAQLAHRKSRAPKNTQPLMSWAWLTRGKEDQTSTKIRPTFDSFVNLCSKLIGEGEQSADEFQELAHFVFECLNSSDGSSLAKARATIEAHLGPVPPQVLVDMAPLAHRLHQWREEMRPPPQAGAHALDGLPRAARAGPPAAGGEEFGADVAFLWPTDPPARPPLHVEMPRGPTPPPAEDAEFPPDVLSAVAGDEDPDASPVEHKAPRAPREAFTQPATQPGAGAVEFSTPEGPPDEMWLEDMCVRVASSNEGGLDPGQLFDNVKALLASPRSDDEVATDLFGLLGVAATAAIPILIGHRMALAGATALGPAATLREPRGGPKRDFAQAPGQQITIATSTEKWELKQQRKAQRKAARQQAAAGGAPEDEYTEADLARWKATRERQLSNPSEAPSGSSGAAPPSGMFELDFSGPAGRRSNILPQGTTRISNQTYEEVTIPANVPEPLGPGERLVPIEEFDEWCRPIFAGYSTLNRIQSRLFPTAYRSNENLLTFIAMMAILRCLGQYIGAGPVDASLVKMVYVAPMKALAGEMVHGLGQRLAKLGIVTRELTGDMQLSQRELKSTHLIVTTPEKWDVITRKSTDVGLTQQVKLLILDEVHLLHDERGPVIEALVARTLRQVESTQAMIRIVGLSATLPNYRDVARFLRVSPERGLFHFSAAYRPVPLVQHYLGVKTTGSALARMAAFNDICYQKVVQNLAAGHQVLVFVHSRSDTGRTARALLAAGQTRNPALFKPGTGEDPHKLHTVQRDIQRSRNPEIHELYPGGLGVHHAGMLRPDRNLMERLFKEGVIRVLVCTATLAWGVNLPAHAVIIKGTQYYNAKKQGGFDDVGMLDVMQIFGRAGRPQFDVSGDATIMTGHDKLPYYLSLLMHELPIESRFIDSLPDNLNAEVPPRPLPGPPCVSGCEAVAWLGYTYMHIRMQANPHEYGLEWEQVAEDPLLGDVRRSFVVRAAQILAARKMVRYNPRTQTLEPTDMGRVASHFYIHHDTIELFNKVLNPAMSQAQIFGALAEAQEFEQLRVREEEQAELAGLEESACPLPVTSSPASAAHKANVLAQAWISQCRVDAFALTCDLNYVAQNLGRIMRALFEIALRRGWPTLATSLHELGLCVEHRMWSWDHPSASSPSTTGATGCCWPTPDAAPARVRVRGGPVTHTILKMDIALTPDFTWAEKIHGSGEPFWLWVEDSLNETIYHSEYIMLAKKQALGRQTQRLSITVPVHDPLPEQYVIHILSDRWLGAETVTPVSFAHLILPEQHPPHTDLLNLQPLPVAALHNPPVEALYRFSHFNPIQTQVFHVAYHSDHNLLLGAPTGSGKTIVAELALLRLFAAHPEMKAVYIGPLKALVRERIEDWGARFAPAIGRQLVELTGETAPDLTALKRADILCTTPEKWDGISRSWQNRGYVQNVGLLIIDEIHMLGQDRGPILEAIVSRLRYIASRTSHPVRVVGLSTALANATDLADWLGIGDAGLFNFRPAVRPVPTTVHIQGFTGRHYCPRMASMNRPIYAAIRNHAAGLPALVFVSSRRQTRLTALALINHAAADECPRLFLGMSEQELEQVQAAVHDENLRHTISFGIGLHHAGLDKYDKALVERLFGQMKIQVLVSTATLAWGVNLPAHLVVVKGTEFYDAKTCRYLPYPITDVLQMIGRAGRPQYDTHGVAVVMCTQDKFAFYKQFLYAPFPVESCLHKHLHDHLNAEIMTGALTTASDAIAWLTWTYFYRRLLINPSYYGLESAEPEAVNQHLSRLVADHLTDLAAHGCIALSGQSICPLPYGRIAAYYYLDYRTPNLFGGAIRAAAGGADSMPMPDMLRLLSMAPHFDELPVRHCEDQLNQQLAESLPWPVDPGTFDSPHTKTHLLLQAHFAHAALPIVDYLTDLKTVLDSAPRILQSLIDVAAEEGQLFPALRAVQLVQMIFQAQWHTTSTLLAVPGILPEHLKGLADQGVRYLPQLAFAEGGPGALLRSVRPALVEDEVRVAAAMLEMLPRLAVATATSRAPDPEDKQGPTGGPPQVGQDAALQVTLTLQNNAPRKSVASPATPP
ncbi:putative DExH-box ATP-dependent RNA helicase DExH14 [Paratrimastix pyriformis]|uniref:DExH-box ATP-dependent RNA helicase DExH14 n=1 Tax=Paratrimastix pyriformis TaxID=342808 RepID=A0ABQ8UVX9_9EUKA|nr:putative DExH-box ATP-dependent RNA helicase DExH14 [Paratrimastix pyriformis]